MSHAHPTTTLRSSAWGRIRGSSGPRQRSTSRCWPPPPCGGLRPRTLDAIIHLRALHCPRAIESTFQHEYLNEVGDWLGRETNAKASEEIKSYRAAFKASKLPTAMRFKDQLAEIEKTPEKPKRKPGAVTLWEQAIS
jgi:hypothetical protein